MGTWTVGLFLAGSLALGSGAGHHALPGSLDDRLGLPEEPVGSLELGPLDEVASQVDATVSSVSEDVIDPVVEPIEEVLDPVLDPLLDPLAEGAIEPILDPIVEEPDPQPDPDPVPEVAPRRRPTQEPDRTSSPDAGGPPGAVPASPTGGVAVEPRSSVIEQAAAPSRPPSDDTESEDERLVPLLEAARFRSPVALPIESGSTLSGILAWLSSGPAIVRVLAAPMELLWVLGRALISAGSGLVAPFSLLVALVVRQVRETRRSSLVG